MKCGVRHTIAGKEKWFCAGGEVLLWDSKAKAKAWLRKSPLRRDKRARVAPFIVHPTKPPRMGTDRFWGWFGGIVGKHCTHPNHVVGVSCKDRAVACSPDCDCCLGNE